jgi:Uma2 family endonuclease
MEPIGVDEYFKKPEGLRPMELVYGFVRQPPAPQYGHQSVVTRLSSLLDAHVRAHGLGRVCVSPVDVVLDTSAALVLQPDIVFISSGRLHIVRDRIWGPPDLAVEVLSRSTARRDRTTKLDWYRRYGVSEVWLVDPKTDSVEVLELSIDPEIRTLYTGNTPIQSRSILGWRATAADIFA